jgi:hypothetical protein
LFEGLPDEKANDLAVQLAFPETTDTFDRYTHLPPEDRVRCLTSEEVDRLRNPGQRRSGGRKY